MKYRVISHDYRNTGGNMMVSVFQIYLPTDNRTVFVNCGENTASMTTVDYVNNFDPDDYDQITIESVDFTEDIDHCGCPIIYEDIFRYCLFEWIKSDCKHYSYRMGIDYDWLPMSVQMMISDLQKDFVEDNQCGLFYTDGYHVFVPTPDGDDDELEIVVKHGSLNDTLAACLGRLTDKLEIDGTFMGPDDLQQLRKTIQDVYYYLYEQD